MDDREAAITARLHALLRIVDETAPWKALLADAARDLGPTHPLTLRIECVQTALLVRGRHVYPALAAWTDLRHRAEAAVGPYHPAAMTIRERYVRSLARRGEPGDLERVVRIRRDDLAGRIEASVPPAWVGAARLELAVARLDRGRFGDHDPSLAARDPMGDLESARELVEVELVRRTAVHGPDAASTGRAQVVRADVLLSSARHQRARPAQSGYAEVVDVANRLLAIDWECAGRHTPFALRAQLLNVGALVGLRRDAEAQREARLAAVLARRYSGGAEARALIALARASARQGREAAVRAARQALTLRQATHAPAGHPVAEARQLVEVLERSAGAGPRDTAGDQDHELWRELSVNLTLAPEGVDIDDRDAPVARTDETVPA